MASALSDNVSRCIYRTARSSSISVGRQHYQVIENRIEPTKYDKIYIQRIDVDTRDNERALTYSTNTESRIFNGKHQIYQQEVPSNGCYGRFIYCTSMDNAKDNVKTVCILVLNQITAKDKLDDRPNFNYGAAMFYINIPLQKITTDQLKEISDEEFKKNIIQATTEWDSFLESVKTVSFNSGRLWEMPIQFTGHEMVHLTIHEPLSRPSVLNIVLQRYDGFSVSHTGD
jgi:hypothetical protein